MTTEKKQRRYTRVRIPKGLLVAWEHDGRRTVSRITILALGGLFITTTDPPPNGDHLRLIFEIPGGEVRAYAIVRDCQPGKGMGIEFRVMEATSRKRLHDLIKVLTKV